MKDIFLIGYSGHAYVVCDIFKSRGLKVTGYFDKTEKQENPYHLKYLGSERDGLSNQILQTSDYFIAIGNYHIREEVYNYLKNNNFGNLLNAIHSSAWISEKASLHDGVLLGANTIVNSLASIHCCTIINTGVIVEHECRIGAFSHIASGATLAGNVKVGHRSFIGANAVVKEGITIGNEVVVGAGAVVIKDIPDCKTVVGNPGRVID
ncbi:MAG: NeuD/PglB/VioB family sugar acetyltransferase [Candidatus Scalindua sp.]|nr:NeuD/PglB/VioB family sugar acetyltransferase [Candidatus Scalindua sp.]